MIYSVDDEIIDRTMMKRRASIDELIDDSDNSVYESVIRNAEANNKETYDLSEGNDMMMSLTNIEIGVDRPKLPNTMSKPRRNSNRRPSLMHDVNHMSIHFFDSNEADYYSDEEIELLEKSATKTMQDVDLRNSMKKAAISEPKKGEVPSDNISDDKSSLPTEDKKTFETLKEEEEEEEEEEEHLAPDSDPKQVQIIEGEENQEQDVDSQILLLRRDSDIPDDYFPVKRHSTRSKCLMDRVDDSLGPPDRLHYSLSETQNHFMKNANYDQHYFWKEYDNPTTRRRRRRLFFIVIALFFLISVSVLMVVYFSQRQQVGKNRWSDDNNDGMVQPEEKVLSSNHNQTTAETVKNIHDDKDFDISHQIVKACIENSPTATKSCGEMCTSKRCCFEEFDCLTVMTEQECSVYAGCLGWLREVRDTDEKNQLQKVVKELRMNNHHHPKNQPTTNVTTIDNNNVWIDSGGRQFSAILLQEACNEYNIQTSYGHDNCWYLCQQHHCCFDSSLSSPNNPSSCSNETKRCQIFSPCQKIFIQ